MKLEGKTAIVTGASQGLGKIIAAEFLAAGADVVMCARDEQLLERVHAELTGECGNRGQRLSYVKADVSQREDVERLVDFALSREGKLDILVMQDFQPRGRSANAGQPAGHRHEDRAGHPDHPHDDQLRQNRRDRQQR